MHMWLPVMIMILTMACGAAERTADGSAVAPSEPQSCADQVADLQRTLRAGDHVPTHIAFRDDVRLPVRADLPLPPWVWGPIVIVKTDGLLFDGQPTTLPALRSRLTDAASAMRADIAAGKAPRHEPPDPRQLAIEIDADATWDRIVSVFHAAAAADYDTLVIPFDKGLRVTPPPRSAVDDELDEIERGDAADRSSQLADLTRRTIEPCPRVGLAFGRVATVDSDGKAGALIDAIAAPLRECDCAIDLPTLRSVLWRALAVSRQMSAAPATLDRSGARLSHPGTAKWRDVHASFTAAGTRFWPVIAR